MSVSCPLTAVLPIDIFSSEAFFGVRGSLLWMDEILHHFETMFEAIVFCWYLEEIKMWGFLGWCETDFVHAQYVCLFWLLEDKKHWSNLS